MVEGFLAARPEEIYYYVQIDAHPDKEEVFRWKLDCANFVGRLMQQKQLRRFFVGNLAAFVDVADAKTNITKKYVVTGAGFLKFFSSTSSRIRMFRKHFLASMSKIWWRPKTIRPSRRLQSMNGKVQPLMTAARDW